MLFKGRLDSSNIVYPQEAELYLQFADDESSTNQILLRRKLEAYYGCHDSKEKQHLKNEIKDIINRQIENIRLEKGVQRALHEEVEAKRKKVAEQEVLDISNIDIMGNPYFFLWHTWFDDVFNRPSGRNGFDIVIGNPPWGAKLSSEEKAKYKQLYQSAKTIKGVQKGSLDTYSLFIELGYTLLVQDGVLSMITPISITSSDALSGLHHILLHNCEDIYISSYAVRPQPVFENAVANTSIVSFRKTLSPARRVYATKMHRKIKGVNLQQLIDNLSFMEVRDHILYGRIPKVSTEIELSILRKLSQHIKLEELIQEEGSPIIYRFAGGRYFKVVTPYSNSSSAERTLRLSEDYAYPLGAILSSNLSFWFYQIYSDNLNWKNYELSEFRVPNLSEQACRDLTELYREYLEDIERNAKTRQTSAASSYTIDSFKEYKIGRSKYFIDKIDDYICPLYGLSTEETEFIKNYEIEFRLGDDE